MKFLMFFTYFVVCINAHHFTGNFLFLHVYSIRFILLNYKHLLKGSGLCDEGPDYWCKSPENAKLCNTVSKF